MMKPLIPLFCLALLMVANAASYTEASNFDTTKLLGTQWYGVLYAKNDQEQLSSCTRYLFTKASNGSYIYQLADYFTGSTGLYATVEQATHYLNINTATTGGAFKFSSASGYYLYVLDYASDYSWVILADTYTFGGFIVAISSTPSNETALNRVVELSIQYGLTSQHLIYQSTTCPYSTLLTDLKSSIS